MFKKLFSPMKINSCEIPNRLVVTAMVTNYCNLDGTVTEKYIAYHEKKAKGGWGLIITEDYTVNEHAGGYDRVAGLWNDDQIKGNMELTERVHKHGSKIFCQIYHAGRQAHRGVNGGVQPMAASAIPCPWKREMPRELSVEEIKDIVSDFGDTAVRAKKSGFDGVEIHAGHGYLLAQFLSPYSNKRTDEYGGCLDNRAKIVKEIIADIRSKVGADFPVIIRFSAIEAKEGGRTMAETRVLAELFEEWGVDGINLSTGLYGSYSQSVISNMYNDHAWSVDYAEEVKRMVKIPVMIANRINDPRMAESILKLDKADFIGMGRGSLADPDLPNKAKAGDLISIRYCIGCLQGCIFEQEGPGGVQCLVNPSLGREYLGDIEKTNQPQKVVVVGGGPGGMEAAKAAASKGHQVKLFEKQEFLGGQFRSAAYPPCKGELATYTNWIINELNKLGVETVLNCAVTKEMLAEEKADVVILATGGIPIIPNLKGVDKPHVCTAEEILLGKVQPGNVIVVAGGGEVGGETAAHLAMQERKVFLVEMKPEILEELDGITTLQLQEILDKYGVDVFTETKVVEILDDGVVVENQQGQFTLPAETVVLGLGYKPNQFLADELKAEDQSVVVIGGAVKTSNALFAIREGYEAGNRIQ